EEGVPVERRYSFPVGIFTREVKAPRSSSDLGKGQRRERGPHGHDTGYLTFPAQGNLEADWAEACAEIILRRCPICEQDSIVGHGRRRKQAHDEYQIGRASCRERE